MIALSIFSMDRFFTYVRYSNFCDTSGLIIDNIYKAEVHLRDIDRAERGYLLTKDTMYVRYVNNAIININNDIKEIGVLTHDNPLIKVDLNKLNDTLSLRVAAAKVNLQYSDSTKQSTLSKYYFDSRELMRTCSRILSNILKEQNALREERFIEEHTYENLTTNTLGYLLVVFCIVTLILFSVLIKELRSRIQFQEELQAKVFDLKRSHTELEEIAYASSHDLQEPLRKIQVFSNMLLMQKNGTIDQESKETLKRINSSANRLQLLVTDLLSLTSLTKTDETTTKVDLNRTIQYLMIDLEDKLKASNAVVKVEHLPTIDGFGNQLKILFNALFDNSLKFTREDVSPVISISSQVVDGKMLVDTNPNLKGKKFIQVKFSDNGIGFDDQFMIKIFRLFQSLHPQHSEYAGKGIGLAICQRIIANHSGYIVAEGKLNEGATFNLFFPIE